MLATQIYEIAIGKPLFRYKPNPTHKLDEVESMLHQMLCFTGEDFEPEQLMSYKKAPTYIDTTCKFGNIPDLLFTMLDDLCSGNLRKQPDLFDYPFELSIRNSKVLEKEEDVVSTAAIMQKCLKLDPAQRLSAEELLMDPWFAGID